MDLQRLFYSLLRKSWIVIILAIIGATAAGYVSMYRYTEKYVSQTTLYVMNRDRTLMTGQAVNSEDIYISRQLLQDYSEIVYSRKVTSAVVEDLKKRNFTKGMGDSSINVGLQKDSNVLVLQVTSSDPETSAAVANAMGRALTDQIRELTNSSFNSISVLDEATVPRSPIPASHTKNVLVGLLAGLALGFGIIYIIELFDTTIRTTEDLESGLNIPVVGIIPEYDIR